MKYCDREGCNGVMEQINPVYRMCSNCEKKKEGGS